MSEPAVHDCLYEVVYYKSGLPLSYNVRIIGSHRFYKGIDNAINYTRAGMEKGHRVVVWRIEKLVTKYRYVRVKIKQFLR